MGPSVRRDALVIGRIAIDTVDAVLLVENISRSRQNPGGVGDLEGSNWRPAKPRAVSGKTNRSIEVDGRRELSARYS